MHKHTDEPLEVRGIKFMKCSQCKKVRRLSVKKGIDNYIEQE